MDTEKLDLHSLNHSDQLNQILSQSMNEISLHRALTNLLNQSFDEVVEHDVYLWKLRNKDLCVRFDDCQFTSEN